MNSPDPMDSPDYMKLHGAYLRATTVAEHLIMADTVKRYERADPKFHVKNAHKAFRDLAEAMGYTVTKIEAQPVEVAA